MRYVPLLYLNETIVTIHVMLGLKVRRKWHSHTAIKAQIIEVDDALHNKSCHYRVEVLN